MSEAAVRQQIYAIISAVPNVGKVYDYERWCADLGQFILLFKDASGKILGWEVSRTACGAVSINSAEDEDRHEYTIRGYMGVQDADQTEKKFNERIEALRAAFRRNFSLDGTCELALPATVPLIETRTFGSVLCHYCEIKPTVQEIN
jgi:hypothetical protein